MSEVQTQDSQVLVIHAFGKSPELKFDMSKIRIAEQRLLEAKNVNPATYTDLESCFGESFRDLKRHLTTVGHQINLADKALRQAKSMVLLDTYPKFLADNSVKKTQDNGDLRDAFLMQDNDYLEALDRVNMLKALESNLDGKIKVIENVSRWMKKQMDLILRSGLTSAQLHVTSGRR
jgi:hypothetical protein